MILLVVTYLAGVLTILSPCILPVLPFVFSKAQGSFWRTGLPLLLGMALTFSVLSGIAIAGGEWISQANEVGRWVAMLLLAFFGLTLLWPRLAEHLLEPFTRWGGRLGSGRGQESVGGSVLIGISTGFLWAPCAGPILGLVLTGAATRGNVGAALGLLVAYSLGAATSLALALFAGQRFFRAMKRFLGFDQIVKRALGVAVLLGVLAIALHLDRTVLTRISKIETASLEAKLLRLTGHGSRAELESPTDAPPMPDIIGATAWINTPPLTRESLAGKVVLVDFWTYSCINCLRTLPYVKSWWEKYRGDGLVVLGVHSPEFAFEKDPANVRKAVEELGLKYPIAVDSERKIWNEFANEYWPAHYFVDRQGRVRHHHFGEGDYEASEAMIRELLAEGGHEVRGGEGAVDAPGVQAASSGASRSPETYVGYRRAQNFLGEVKRDHTSLYSAPEKLAANQWALAGEWRVEEERAVARGASTRLVFRFRGRDLHLVLGGGRAKISFRVKLDGQAPGAEHGVDIDEDGRGEIREQRLYQLLRRASPEGEHTFEIEFSAPGAEVYAFTFG